jgi:acyl carrier protein
VGAAPADRAGAVQDWLVGRVAQALSVPADQIDPEVPFADYGADSVVVTRLAGDLAGWLGREVSPVLLFDHPTIAELAGHLAGQP